MITINGVEYQKKGESSNKKSRSNSTMMNTALMLGSMFGGMYGGGLYERKRPMVNLVEEFEKIQKKESKFSKSDRDWVEWQFNRVYTKVN